METACEQNWNRVSKKNNNTYNPRDKRGTGLSQKQWSQVCEDGTGKRLILVVQKKEEMKCSALCCDCS